MTTRRTFLSLSAAAALTTALASCSSSGTNAGTVSTGGTGADGQVILQFWTWAPKIDEVVALWNAANPDIQVEVNSQAQGGDLYTKLVTAAKAGNGPDIAQVEYQALPSMITAGVVADITEATANLKEEFTPALTNLVTFSSKQYAIPQDSAPMLLLYRKDLFAQYGLQVPTTWEEFASTARALKSADASKSLTTFSSGDPGWFSGLCAQAGAQWWSTSGENWTVGINDAASNKVASYWQDLVQSGAVLGEPMYTPQWNTQLNDGTILAWPTAVWGPGVLEGVAPDTLGKWASAPLPTWNPGQSADGQWGGSSNVVTEGAPNKEAAIKFLAWLNTSPEAVDALITKGSLYPAALSGQSSSALSAAPTFLPEESDFYAQVKDYGATVKSFTWGPNVTTTYNSYKDAFGKAIQNKASFTDALTTMQDTTVADMTKAGFTVSGS